MSPLAFLALLILLTAGARVSDVVFRRRRGRSLRRLASEWRMNYVPGDSLLVTPKIARNFPVPGAANLQIRDLIYGIEDDRYRYVFTAEYTAGVVRTKRRTLRVGTFSEPRNRHARPGAAAESPVVLAAPRGAVLDQYRSLSPKPVEEPGAPAAGTDAPPL